MVEIFFYARVSILSFLAEKSRAVFTASKLAESLKCDAGKFHEKFVIVSITLVAARFPDFSPLGVTQCVDLEFKLPPLF